MARKRELGAFKEEFADMTEDEHAFLTRIKAYEMIKNKRQLTFVQATTILRQYRELKARAKIEGVTPEILAARENVARRQMAEKPTPPDAEGTNEEKSLT